MEIKVQLNNLRTAPRKVRLVADLIRNKDVDKAKSLLLFTVKKPTEPILKLLNSGIASAINNYKLQEDDLYVSKITVNEGTTLKRWHPMSRGRAYPIMKRTSHITLILSEKEKSEKSKSKERLIEADKRGLKRGKTRKVLNQRKSA